MGTDPTLQVPAPASPRFRYPRPWWISVPLFFLGLFWLVGGPLYSILVVSAFLKHTLFTADRDLLDPGFLLWNLPLCAASIWAFVDLMKEDRFLRQQHLAKMRQPPEEHWQEKLAAARAKGDRHAEVAALGNTGFWLNRRNRHDEAEPYLEEALSLARTLGDQPFEEERALSGLARVAFSRGDLDVAEDLLRQSLAVATTLDLDHRDEVADTYAHVGEFLCQYRDKREEGCQMLARAQAIYHELGQHETRWLNDEQRMRDLRRQYGDESA